MKIPSLAGRANKPHSAGTGQSSGKHHCSLASILLPGLLQLVAASQSILGWTDFGLTKDTHLSEATSFTRNEQEELPPRRAMQL